MGGRAIASWVGWASDSELGWVGGKRARVGGWVGRRAADDGLTGIVYALLPCGFFSFNEILFK